MERVHCSYLFIILLWQKKSIIKITRKPIVELIRIAWAFLSCSLLLYFSRGVLKNSRIVSKKIKSIKGKLECAKD